VIEKIEMRQKGNGDEKGNNHFIRLKRCQLTLAGKVSSGLSLQGGMGYDSHLRNMRNMFMIS